jgi:acetyl-CoA synthetase
MTIIDNHPELYASYQWLVPTQFNIAQACLYQWAQNPSEGRRVAIFHENTQGDVDIWSYARLVSTTNQLANALQKMGVSRGDRVAIMMGQRPETIVAYMAVFAVGAIAVPLQPTLNTHELAFCINDAQIRVAVIDAKSLPGLLQAQSLAPGLGQIVGLDFQHEATILWRTLLARQTNFFTPINMRSDSPALLFYSRHETQQLGALLSHGALIGNLPGFVASQNWFPQKGDVFWTPTDWRNPSGLMNGLLPVLYFGYPMVSTLDPLTPQAALDVMNRYNVTNALMSASTLARLVTADGTQGGALRAIVTDSSAGVTETIAQACQARFGVAPNAIVSTPETGCIVCQSHNKWPSPTASLGKPVPGHQVAVLDARGAHCRTGTRGTLALNRSDPHGHPDPAFFLGYWRNEPATQARLHGPWFLTSETVRHDEQNNYWPASAHTPPD